MKIPVRTASALIVALALLVVAGIAGTTLADPADPSLPIGVEPADPRDAPTSSPILPDGPDPAPRWDDSGNAQPVEPRPGMTDVRARPFDRAIVNADGSITILFVSGVEPCAVLDHVDVNYASDVVTITLFEGRDAAAGDVACIEIGVLKSVTITLSEPLADRTIVDGAA
jgi:hypothetical protein